MTSLSHACTIASVASAFPDVAYTQSDVKRILGITNPVVERLLNAPHIQTRRLHFTTPSTLSPIRTPMLIPNDGVSCTSPVASETSVSTVPLLLSGEVTPMTTKRRNETPAELQARMLDGLRQFGVQSARRALEQAAITAQEVDFIVAVTSTGLPMPGFSAILIQELGFRKNVHRFDLVGMGCNAGMTGMKTLSMLLSANPNSVGVLVCCEVCSAMYVNDDSVKAGIVNSLFGDGAVATVIAGATFQPKTTAAAASSPSPRTQLLAFECCTLPDYFDDMRYEVDEDQQQLCFRLSKRIPHAIGDNVHVPVLRLLESRGLTPSDIQHWVSHAGGAAVMEGVATNLNLPKDALRHTSSVLRDYGNISSGSFLASYERLLQEHEANSRCEAQAQDEDVSPRHVMRPGDNIVFIAMGPGATIEIGLGVVTA